MTVRSATNIDVVAASAWVVEHLSDFDPYKDGRVWRIEHGQRLGELATAVYCQAELGSSKVAAFGQMADLLERVLSRPDFRDRPFRRPAEFILISDVYAALRRLGRAEIGHRDQLQAFVDSGRLEATERLPHRLMDMRLGLEWAGLRTDWPSLEELSKGTLLAQHPSPFDLDEPSVYALTHVIMFLYGFGTRQADVRELIDTERLQWTLSVLAASAVDDAQWDLVAELLLCWDCVGLAATPLYEAAWSRFVELQRDDGSFPGPERALKSWGVPDLDELRVEDGARREVEIAYRYHTTLVAILAGLVHARTRRPAVAAREEASPSLRESVGPAPAPIWPARQVSAVLDADESIREIADRSGDWTWQMANQLGSFDSVSPSTVCALLDVAWLCHLQVPQGEGRFREVLDLAFQTLMGADWDVGPSDLPGTTYLELLAAGVLLSHDLVVPDLGVRLLSAAKAIASSDVAGDRSPGAGRIGEARVLLEALEVVRADAGAALATGEPPKRPLAARSEVDELVAAMNVATRFGTVDPARGASQVGSHTEALVVGAAQALMQHDFHRGSRAMRALNYIAPDRPEGAELRRELRRRERRGGGFGFLGLEASELARSRSSSLDAALLDLSLRATFETMWTLAEVVDGWRLLRAVPRIGATWTGASGRQPPWNLGSVPRTS